MRKRKRRSGWPAGRPAKEENEVKRKKTKTSKSRPGWPASLPKRKIKEEAQIK